MYPEKRELWNYCRASAYVCDQVNGNCNECNSLNKKWGLERKKEEDIRIKKERRQNEKS